MAENYQVVLSDLQELSRNFSSESDRYDKLLPVLVPPQADSGDGRLNATTKAVMASLKVLHGSLANKISDHAAKLHDVRDSYEREDIDSKELFDDLNPKTWE